MNLLDWILPRQCLGCRQFSAGERLCSACLERFPLLKDSCCPSCALPFESEGGHLCFSCLETPPPFRRTFALAIYRGILHDLVTRMKFRPEERIAEFLGRWLGESITLEEPRPEVILPVPLHSRRLRQRGFNQSAVIARQLSRQWGIPATPFLMERIRETAQQTGLSRVERKKNLSEAFRVLHPESIEGKRVLLVDDVYTTGATLLSAAAVLRDVGVASVDVAVVARTP